MKVSRDVLIYVLGTYQEAGFTYKHKPDVLQISDDIGWSPDEVFKIWKEIDTQYDQYFEHMNLGDKSGS